MFSFVKKVFVLGLTVLSSSNELMKRELIKRDT